MRYVLVLTIALFSFLKPKPSLYLIGDSTVKAGQGKGENQMWGWGSVLAQHFDSTKINIQNYAIGGRSSRTFLTDARWEPLLAKMQKGDFLILQFGHNDDWAINDTIRARGTIKGIGQDSVKIFNLLKKTNETVYSYGWYINKYIREAKQKGLEVYVCSPVPFNKFEQNKVSRPADSYPKWAKEQAKISKAHFIDLHELTAQVYDTLGFLKTKAKYFTEKDNVHTNLAGAELNALNVALGLKKLKKTKLKAYLL
jgi:rhamnogalacturonan acetylesterase